MPRHITERLYTKYATGERERERDEPLYFAIPTTTEQQPARHVKLLKCQTRSPSIFFLYQPSTYTNYTVAALYIYIQRPYKNVSRPSGFPWWCWKQISETIADGNNVTKERHSKEFRPMATVWLGQTKSSATPRNETNLKASPFSLLRIVYNLDDQSLPVVPISFSFSLRRSVTSFSADTLRLGFYFSSLLLLYTRQHNVINLMCQWALGVCACRLSAARSSS